MVFLNPLFLIGLASAAIPLIIHLSRSRRTKKLRFSTTRFLTDQFLRSYRMSRLKELLLLAARMALCALFATALAQPFVRPGGKSAPLTQQRRTVVFVIDNSASMGYREDDTTLLERAKNAAGELLDALREGDRASLVLAGRRLQGPEVLFDEPTPEMGDVRQSLDQLQPTGLGTDLTGALLQAERIVQSGSADGSREVYVFSDLQDSGWELLEENRPTATADTNLFFVSVRAKDPSNLALTALQYGAARPMVGVPWSIRPHVRNESSKLAACDVELHVDGKKVGQQRIEGLQAGRWSAPTFHHTFDEGGWHTGYVEVKDPVLVEDNRRYFAFQVLDAIEVLAVNGAPSTVPRLDELFFLRAALGAGGGQGNSIKVVEATPVGLGAANLARFPLVILANVESLPPQAVDKLQTFVDQGGGLMVFLGDNVNATFYNRSLFGADRLHGGLLPGRLTGIQGDADQAESSFNIGEVDGNHPALAALASGEAGDLSQVRLKSFWGFDPGESTVLMRADNGSPLLCERSFGRGRVMMFASSCDRDWTNLPVRPAYLPWIYRIFGHLAREPLGQDNFYLTGGAVPAPIAATEGIAPLVVRKPDGTIGNLATTDDPDRPLAFFDTQQVGVYRLHPPGKPEEEQIFVANLEPYESDLTAIDDVLATDEQGDPVAAAQRSALIEKRLKSELLPGRSLVTYVGEPSRVAEASMSARKGWRLWDLALLLALAVALLEPWLANWINLQRYFRPRGEQAPAGRTTAPAPQSTRPPPAREAPANTEETQGVA